MSRKKKEPVDRAIEAYKALDTDERQIFNTVVRHLQDDERPRQPQRRPRKTETNTAVPA